MIIGNLAVAITSKSHGFSKGMRGIKRDLREFRRDFNDIARGALKWGAIVSGAALAAGAGFTAFVLKVAQAGDVIAKNAKRLGMTAEQITAIQFAAERSGASLEEFINGTRNLLRYADEAAQGTKSYVDLFARLGMTVTDSAGNLKDAERLFLEFADGLNRLGTDAEKTALAVQVLGRGGLGMLPMLKEGRSGIEALLQKGRKLGVWTAQQARDAEALVDATTDLTTAWGGMARNVASVFMPTMTKAITILSEHMAKNRDKLVGFFAKARSSIAGFLADTLDWVVQLDASGALDNFVRRVSIGFYAMVGAAKMAWNAIKVTIGALQTILLDHARWVERHQRVEDYKFFDARAAYWKRLLDEDRRGLADMRALLEKDRKSPGAVNWAQRKALEEIVAQVDAAESYAKRKGQRVNLQAIALREMAASAGGMNAMVGKINELESQMKGLADWRGGIEGFGQAWNDMLGKVDLGPAQKNILGHVGKLIADLRDALRNGTAEAADAANEQLGKIGDIAAPESPFAKMAGGERFAGALEYGTAAAYSAALRPNDSSRAIEKHTAETAKATKKTAEAVYKLYEVAVSPNRLAGFEGVALPI